MSFLLLELALAFFKEKKRQELIQFQHQGYLVMVLNRGKIPKKLMHKVVIP
jgi:hypothetical protein